MRTYDTLGREIVGTKTLEEHRRDADEFEVVHFVASERTGWVNE